MAPCIDSADVCIVGGGVVGCALAYQLGRLGLDVVVLDRGQLGGGSTARNAGGVRQQFSTEINVRLQMRSVSMLDSFKDEVGTSAEFRQIGYLLLFSTLAQVADFRSQLAM